VRLVPATAVRPTDQGTLAVLLTTMDQFTIDPHVACRNPLALRFVEQPRAFGADPPADGARKQLQYRRQGELDTEEIILDVDMSGYRVPHRRQTEIQPKSGPAVLDGAGERRQRPANLAQPVVESPFGVVPAELVRNGDNGWFRH
jgi:hypothetical protein